MSVSKRTRFAVLTRDRFTCRYCGRSAPTVELHVDHVHPASRGGTDAESNLVTACVECNASKSDKVIPVAALAGVVAELSFPHHDRCSACGFRYAWPHSEINAESGYYAFYQCNCGHSWRTYWASCHRLTAKERAEWVYEIAEGALVLARDSR